MSELALMVSYDEILEKRCKAVAKAKRDAKVKGGATQHVLKSFVTVV